MSKEARARININKLLEEVERRFLANERQTIRTANLSEQLMQAVAQPRS